MAAERITESDVIAVVSAQYNLTVSECSSLPAGEGQNFHLRAGNGDEFVLKLSPRDADLEILQLQAEAVSFLASQDLNFTCPRYLPAVSGEYFVEVGPGQIASLREYLSGHLLVEVSPYPDALLQRVGSMFATLDNALTGFSAPPADRKLIWDLRQAGWILDHVEHVPADRLDLLRPHLESYLNHTLTVLESLNRSVIHGDGNDYNIVVQPDGKLGLFDFGDIVLSHPVCELAVTCAYALFDQTDPVGAAMQVTRGYNRDRPLEEVELEILFNLICVRLCISVVHSALQHIEDPSNEYWQISDAPAWDALERLSRVHYDLAHYRIREACDLEPCPAANQIQTWLADPRRNFAPLLATGLESTVVFDLSVSNPHVDVPSTRQDLESLEKELVRKLNDSQAQIGIGRYDEPRLCYAGEQFAAAESSAGERRTIHIGVDLFSPAGTEVRVPLDGSVHSTGHNSRPFDYGPTVILKHRISDELSFFTLYGHLSASSLESLKPGDFLEAGSVVGYLGPVDENGGWPPHLHFQVICDLLDYEGDFPGVAPPSQRTTWLSLSPDPGPLMPFEDSVKFEKELSDEDVAEQRRKHVGPSLSLAYDKPLLIVRGCGQYLYDSQGRRYLDCVNNVAHVGHCHPAVVRAETEQAAVLNTNTRYLHQNLARLAERLCARLPAPLSVCYLVCSGSEANELALRMARAHTGRKEVLVLDGGYHGNTQSLIEVSPYKFDGPGGAGAPAHVYKVPMPDPFRGAFKGTDPEAGRKYADQVAEAISKVESSGGRIGAFLFEPLLGCGGQVVPAAGFLKAAVRHVRQASGVCIADEVQIGFGRVGTAFWGFETQNIAPDIVTLGKPIGNGYPLGAVITTPEIASSFDNGMEYFNTFGGNPVSCAVGLAVLDVIEKEGLQEHALQVGRFLRERLQNLQQKFPLIGDVRGEGLFIGVELVRDRASLEPAAEEARYIVERLKEEGILLSTDGPLHNVLKIKPPLLFDRADAEHLVDTLAEVLAENALKASGFEPRRR